jgi:hypothetical protein
VGVASAADQFCEKISIYGRVSKVYSSFLAPVVEAPSPATPPAPNGACAACVASSFDGNSSCAGALADCQGNTDCDAIASCVRACATADSACYIGCESPRAAGLGLFEHLMSCTACSVCDPQCGGTACGWSAEPPSMTTSSNASTATAGTGGTAPRSGAGGSGGGATGAPSKAAGSADTCIPATLSCSSSGRQTDGGAMVLAIACVSRALARRRRTSSRS